MKPLSTAIVSAVVVLLLSSCCSSQRRLGDELLRDIESGDPSRIRQAAEQLVQTRNKLTPVLWEMVQKTEDIEVKKACFSVLEAWGEISSDLWIYEVAMPVVVCKTRIPLKLRREFLLYRYEVGGKREVRAIAASIFPWLPVKYLHWLESLWDITVDEYAREHLEVAIESSRLALKGESTVLAAARKQLKAGKGGTRVLVHAGAKCGTERLFEFLTKEAWPHWSNSMILDALGAFLPARSKDFAISKLDDEHWAVRVTAAGVLADVGDDECEKHLADRLVKEDYSLALECISGVYYRMVGREKAEDMAYKLSQETYLRKKMPEEKKSRYRHVVQRLRERAELERHGWLLSRE